MSGRLLPLLCCLLVACGGGESTTENATTLVIYAPEDRASQLTTLFEEFSSATGIAISARWDTSANNTAAVVGKSGVPADILLYRQPGRYLARCRRGRAATFAGRSGRRGTRYVP